jgi:peptide deformylase
MEGVTLIRALKIYPDQILLGTAEPVVEFDQALAELAEEMVETCRRYDDALGLAAPQLGINKRIVVVQTDITTHEYKVLVNPSWQQADEKVSQFEGIEGCLSLPGMQVKVKRHGAITVHAQTVNREPVEFSSVGLLARVIQHECDHLEGKVIIDYLPRVSRSIQLTKFLKARTLIRRKVRAQLREQYA